MDSNKSVILILAAGEAKRLGHAKQLLEYGGKSLLQRSIETALSTGLNVIVVLGAYSDKTGPVVRNYPVHSVFNKHWADGISTSIRAGVEFALDQIPDLDGVLLTLVDQPQITSKHLKTLLDTASKSSDVVATEYQGFKGVPAYFPKNYFEELKKLTGDQGARILIKEFSNQVTAIPFTEVWQDIDTEQDWKDFIDYI